MRGNQRISQRCRALILAALPALGCIGNANAAITVTWNAGNGNWQTSTNWNPTVVPGAGSIAMIIHNDIAPRTINFNGDYPVSGLLSVIVNQSSVGQSTLSIAINTLQANSIILGST